jgi:twitching motility protein PilI
MSNKLALREFQTRLAQRLQAARAQVQTARWLAVECAGLGHACCHCSHAGRDLLPRRATTSVPYTQPWLLGVANLRGGLHAVVDLDVSSWACVDQGVPRRTRSGRIWSRCIADLNINCSLAGSTGCSACAATSS